MSLPMLLSAVAGTGDSDGPVLPSPHHARDAAWVEEIQRGNERSFEALFRAYAEALCRFAASYMDDAGGAQEIVDDVFVTIWEHRTVWEPASGAAAYLFGAVRNRALNAVRNARRLQRRTESVRDESPECLVGHIGEADAQVRTHGDAEEVDRVLAALPLQRRQVMLLRWRYEMTPDEIAAAMGMSRNAVYLVLQRSLETLRTLFGRSLR